MKKLLRNFRPVYLLLPVVIIALIIIFPPVVALFRKLFGTANFAISKLFKGVGLDVGQQNQIDNALFGKTGENCWSPGYWKLQSHKDTLAQVPYGGLSIYEWYAPKIHGAQSFMGGVSMDKYMAIFHEIGSKEEVSLLCDQWAQHEGTDLPQWMLSGWFFGLVSSMGNSDFAQIDALVQNKPVSADLS